jgi:hypothetical protein
MVRVSEAPSYYSWGSRTPEGARGLSLLKERRFFEAFHGLRKKGEEHKNSPKSILQGLKPASILKYLRHD